MLGRRGVRTKVMQVLFSFEINKEASLGSLQQLLDKNILLTTPLYLTYLKYVIDVCNYSMVDMAKKMAKYIKTEEDKTASTILAANKIVQFWQYDLLTQDFLTKEKIHFYTQEEVTKSLFADLSQKPKYKEYSALKAPTLEQDKEILEFIIKKIFAASKELDSTLDDSFVNYDDDQAMLLHVLLKQVKSYTEEGKNVFTEGILQWKSEKKFADELLKVCYLNNDLLTKELEPNIKNWDMDRIAAMDLVLMKMSLCELKFFPNIPVKVSINEYIDLAKLYSTPKSKDFVNGILDRLREKMQAAGEINKQGRGLVDN